MKLFQLPLNEIRWGILLVGLVFTVSCTSESKKNIRSIKEEMLAVHDEVMPKMMQLSSIETQLQVIADSLASIDSSQALPLISAAHRIKLANEGMMDWMHQLDVDQEGVSEEEKSRYFANELKKIEDVRDEMLAALQSGTKILNDNQ